MSRRSLAFLVVVGLATSACAASAPRATLPNPPELTSAEASQLPPPPHSTGLCALIVKQVDVFEDVIPEVATTLDPPPLGMPYRVRMTGDRTGTPVAIVAAFGADWGAWIDVVETGPGGGVNEYVQPAGSGHEQWGTGFTEVGTHVIELSSPRNDCAATLVFEVAEATPPWTPASADPPASPRCFLATECPPSPSLPIDTSDWVPFTSERYGYTFGHPPTWTAIPATQAWTFEADHTPSARCCMHEGSDQFAEGSPYTIGNPGVLASDYPIWLRAFAVDVPASPSEDGWIGDYYASRPDMAPGYCEYADAQRRPILVDGHRGTMVVGDTECADSAFIFTDSQVHVFWLEAYDRPAQMPEWRTLKTDLLEAFLSMVEFRP